MELISVIMPTYNVERFVEEAIKSILCQTYKNIELIVVDDCSTDKTYEKLQMLAKEDSRIQLYRNSENQKICKTLNTALKYANGKYIARMDGDDVCSPERLQILKQYLDAHQECSLVGSQVYSVNEEGKIITEKYFLKSWKFIKENMLVMNCVLHIWLARREIYDILQGYRELPYVEDYDFLLRGMRYGFQYGNVPDFIYSVRTRVGNTQSTNGIYQEKAKYYVKKLYKRELIEKKELYNYSEYENEIKSTEKEKAKFNKAHHYMVKALGNRERKLILVVNLILAMLYSKYYTLHILNSVWIRKKIKVEKRENER